MEEEPLEKGRDQLALNYWVRLQGHSQDHPTKDTLKPYWEKERRKAESFGGMVTEKAKQVQFNY